MNDIKNQLLEEFAELVKIPTQPKMERAICDCLKTKLIDLGLTVWEDDVASKIEGTAGNLIARLPGNADKDAILLCAHMDRVPNHGQIKPILDEQTGLMTSDGTSILAADDVSGICVILETLREIQKTNQPRGDVEVVFSVAEEIGAQGIKCADLTPLKAKQAYVLDSPGRIGFVVNQSPTHCVMTITVNGLAAHAGHEPEKGINAIRVASEVVVSVKDGRLSPSMTSNFGCIEGGRSFNVVCDKVVITGEARSTNNEQLEQYLDQIQETAAEIAKRYSTTIDMQVKYSCQGYQVLENRPIIQNLFRAMQSHGVIGQLHRSGGGSDANHLNECGIEAVVLALGYSKNHTTSEQIYYEDMFKCSQIIQTLIYQ